MLIWQQIKTNFSSLLFSIGGAIMAAVPLGLVFIFVTWPKYQVKIEQNKKETVRVAVESVYEILQTYYDKAQAGALSEVDAQKSALALIEKLRYGGAEYFWVNDQSPKMLMHPIKPELNGKDVSKNEDPTGKKIFIEMVKVSQQAGSGYVDYMWSKAGAKDPVPKTSYIKLFKPWGWIVGSGVYADDILAEVKQARNENFFWIAIATFMAVAISLLVGVRQLTKIIIPVQNVIETLSDESDELTKTAESLSTSSQYLSQSVQTQSSSLHETNVTMKNISELVMKTSTDSKKSAELADQTKEYATKGLEASEQLNKSMSEINTSQQNLNYSLDENLKKLAEVTQIINQISDKTNMINDIVFQTKLLSFNASVEAARAGESGKGFAVVAEEIGKLAQMSGVSAQEISTIVHSSNQRVRELTESIRKNLGDVIHEVQQSVQNGLVNSKTSLDMLSQVVQIATDSSQKSIDISTSATEQSRGVEETAEALKMVSDTSETINTAVTQTENSAEELVERAKELKEITMRLNRIVSHQRQPKKSTNSNLVNKVASLEHSKNSSLRSKKVA